MSLLTQKDQPSILQFLRELYTLCSLEDFSGHVVSLLPNVIPSEFTGFGEINFQKYKISVNSLSRSIDYSDAERTIQTYFLEHPIMARYVQTGDSKTYKLSDFLSENQLHRSEGLYHRFLQPLGLEDQMGFILPTQVAGSKDGLSRVQAGDITLSLHRAERSFSERDRVVLNLLRPHLLQAYQNAQALTQMQQELAQRNRTVEQLGTITLTRDGKVQLITQKAWTLLKQYFHTQSYPSNSLPENLQRWVNHQIALQTQDGIPPCSVLDKTCKRAEGGVS
jgi:hypothetical protein